MLPLGSTAAHSPPPVAHETPGKYSEVGNGTGDHDDAGPVGVVETIRPWATPATHRLLEAQVNGPGAFRPVAVTDQAGTPPDGLAAAKMSPLPSPVMHRSGRAAGDAGEAAIIDLRRRPRRCAPAGAVLVSTLPLVEEATHSVVEGQATAFMSARRGTAQRPRRRVGRVGAGGDLVAADGDAQAR